MRLGVPARLAVVLLALLIGVPAVLLTLARLSGSQGEHAIVLQAFTPLAVPGYVALALLSVALIRWVRPRAVGATIAVVSVAALVLHLWWLVPDWRAQAAQPDGQQVRVMSANLLIGAADTDAVLDTARDERVDLLALQEVTTEALARLEAAGVRSTYPYRVGTTGTVVYARTPLTEAEPVLVAYGGTDTWGLTWQGMRVLAVHPTYPRNAPGWRSDFRELTAVTARERPGLLVGDFNASADHATFRRLLDLGYRDAAEQAGSGWQPTWPSPGSTSFHGIGLPPLVAIDHAVVGDGLAAASTRTVRIPASDHLGLIADLRAS